MVGGDPSTKRIATLKRIATWAFYAISTLAIVYLALYAYAAYRGSPFTPGDPIHIFRKPGSELG